MSETVSREEAERLLADATPGPWLLESKHDYPENVTHCWLDGVERWRGFTNNVPFGEDFGTARLAAAAPALAESVVALHDEVVKLREVLFHVYADTRQWDGEYLLTEAAWNAVAAVASPGPASTGDTP